MIFILTELGLIHIFRTFNPFNNHIRRHFAIHFLFMVFEIFYHVILGLFWLSDKMHFCKCQTRAKFNFVRNEYSFG